MRKITLWLISVVGACLVLAVGWGILTVPKASVANPPPHNHGGGEATPLFLVTIPQLDGVVPTDIYGPPLLMEGIANKDGIIQRLVASGSLTFPTDDFMGNGIGDIGDVLVFLNEQNCDLFDPATAVNLDGSVTLNSGPDHLIEIFVRPDEDGDSLMNAFIRITWHGEDGKAHEILVGGPDKNWCVLPTLGDFPNLSTVRGGVDPATCGSSNVIVGQTFRIRQGPKKKDPCRWDYGDDGTSAYVVIGTAIME